MSFYLTISANFRTGTTLPSIDDQYHDLWKLAKLLEAAGFPINEWFPPAAAPADSLLNRAFSANGPSPVALAMSKADKANLASDLRILGVWNGIEDAGGAAYTTTYNTSRIPSNLDFSAQDASAFIVRSDYSRRRTPRQYPMPVKADVFQAGSIDVKPLRLS